MIFGDVFMRNYLVAFDKENNRIGFEEYFKYCYYYRSLPSPLFKLGLNQLVIVIFDAIGSFMILTFAAFIFFIQQKKNIMVKDGEADTELLK